MPGKIVRNFEGVFLVKQRFNIAFTHDLFFSISPFPSLMTVAISLTILECITNKEAKECENI